MKPPGTNVNKILFVIDKLNATILFKSVLMKLHDFFRGVGYIQKDKEWQQLFK